MNEMKEEKVGNPQQITLKESIENEKEKKTTFLNFVRP